ncbi:MAG: hypothetical protein ABSE39_03680 [Candidatus Bathyarchaeia archaeon]
MAKRTRQSKDEMTELLRDLLIVQLGLAKVPQMKIREIAGCDLNRVNRVVSLLRTRKPK